MLQFGYESLISGNVRTDLSDVDKRLPDLDQKFSSGTALKVGFSHSEKFDFGIAYAGLNYKKWQLAESSVARFTIQNKTYAMIEPENSTSIVALDVGMIF